MGDPLQGWSVLSDCLKKDSIMLVGLYSETARKNIADIRKKINYLNTKITKKNIIKFRNEILENNYSEWNNIKYSPDFYSTSGVRDLLFHVQEQRFTIDKIKNYMKKLGLVFLGFDNRYILEKFKKNYNQRKDLYDLNKWKNFEKKNPRIFSGMYQFWCKKF